MKEIASLNSYTLQFTVLGNEESRRLEEIKKIFKTLFAGEYNNSSWPPKARDTFNFLTQQEQNSIGYQKIYTELREHIDSISKSIHSSLSSTQDE